MPGNIFRFVEVFGFLFALSTPAVATIIVVIIAGSIAAGVLLGRWLRHGAPHLHGSIAGDVATADPTFTIPMMHLQALSDASSAHTERIESLENRVPDEVMWLLLLVVVLSLGALAMHLTVVGRGVVSSVAAAVVVVLILLTLLDLDRPHRGFITVPDSALVALVS